MQVFAHLGHIGSCFIGIDAHQSVKIIRESVTFGFEVVFPVSETSNFLGVVERII
jgi:hypothetical protein